LVYNKNHFFSGILEIEEFIKYRMFKIENLAKSYDQKEQQVLALTNSIEITNKLFYFGKS